jgi:hypothetical protein
MEKILMILGAIILAGLVAAGSFWGGMQYQSSRDNQVRAEFMNARGLANGGEFPLEGQLPAGGQRPGFSVGGGTTGQVKAIDGNVMTLSTAQDVTTVLLSESTQIEKTVAGTVADLQPGTRVVVTGQQDSGQNLTASRIQILDGDTFIMPDPAAQGTEP